METALNTFGLVTGTGFNQAEIDLKVVLFLTMWAHSFPFVSLLANRLRKSI